MRKGTAVPRPRLIGLSFFEACCDRLQVSSSLFPGSVQDTVPRCLDLQPLMHDRISFLPWRRKQGSRTIVLVTYQCSPTTLYRPLVDRGSSELSVVRNTQHDVHHSQADQCFDPRGLPARLRLAYSYSRQSDRTCNVASSRPHVPRYYCMPDVPAVRYQPGTET